MLLLTGILFAQAALAGSELDAFLAQKVDHYVHAHRRSLRAARDFDRELDEAVAGGRPDFLRTSGAYRQLQALHELQHADIEAIGGSLAELAATNPEESRKAARALETKLALVSARAAAGALAGELNAHFHGLVAEDLAAPFAGREDNDAPSLTLQLLPSLLDLEIAQAAARIDFPRETAPKIRPGTGPEGNMTGGNFPPNTWALTFDDGPSPKYTRPLVDALLAHGKKATFFWLAQNLAANRSVIDHAKRAGMSLNDHSFTHANLSKASPAELRREIVESAELEARFYGQRPEFFRCPYGAGTRQRNVRELIAEQDMVHVFWNVDSLDWQDKDPNVIFERVRKQMSLEKRGIILFHDIHPQSLAAAKLLLDYAAARPELRWVTIPEIRDELNGKR